MSYFVFFQSLVNVGWHTLFVSFGSVHADKINTFVFEHLLPTGVGWQVALAVYSTKGEEVDNSDPARRGERNEKGKAKK